MLPAAAAALFLAVMRRGAGAPARPPVRWWFLAAAALAAQIALYDPPLNEQPWALVFGPWVYVASLLCVLLVLARNALAVRATWASFPWWLAAAGVGLNVIVVTANHGYMPQSVEARQIAGSTAAALGQAGTLEEVAQPPQLTNVTVLTADTALAWLGDIIPEPSWLPLANVVSLGDLMLATGIACTVLLRGLRGTARAPTSNKSARTICVEQSWSDTWA
jgi:hypothetical protein